MARKTNPSVKSKKASGSLSKIFVLDTNVLLHDPTSVYRFEENDVYLPIMTLEELDNNKKGLSEVARNARQVTRILDEIVNSHTESADAGYRSAEDMQVFLGREGTATTALRPTGLGEFDGVRLNVVSEGDFIENGTKIRVTQIEGSRIVVKKV